MPTAAEINLSSLPEDQRAAVADLLREHAELLLAKAALTAETTDLKQIVQRLEHLVAELNHVVHGKKSEKLSEDDRQLAFEDLETAVAEVETQRDDRVAKSEAPRRKVTPAQRNRGNLPAGLPRIEQIVEPGSLECPCGCGQMHRIGEDRAERLDIVPAQLRAIVTIRPKYACRVCTDGVTQAPAPAALIEGGLPTEGAIAHVLVSKYADHLPLYRQSQILARSGVSIHRSTLADWVGVAGFHLRPVVDRLAQHLKASTNDERQPCWPPSSTKMAGGPRRREGVARPWSGATGLALFWGGRCWPLRAGRVEISEAKRRYDLAGQTRHRPASEILHDRPSPAQPACRCRPRGAQRTHRPPVRRGNQGEIPRQSG